jgi:hypothetical protein
MAHFVAVIIVGATGKEKVRKGDKEKSGDLFEHNNLVLIGKFTAKFVPYPGINLNFKFPY